MERFVILSQQELDDWSHREVRLTLVVAILLGGDRLRCCDEAVALEVDGQIVGVASISPEGESYDGKPAIVGLYVVPERRRQGYSMKIMQAVIQRCQERGLVPVRIDVMSGRLMRVIEKLPAELKQVLDVRYQGDMMDSMRE